MGWTNLVPIFHDNVTYILQPEIPDVTVPFIDDVPIRGLVSKYRNGDRTYETIPENAGIRCFVWEHFQNLNRVVQRMKYCRGTFSGPKTTLCRIVTDNVLAMVAALDWLSKTYHINHIQISAYNSRASSIVECSHRTIRDSIVKACDGDITQ